jgi:ArsR family transcriptional regulator, virulence genes transcriptional regulator
MERMGVWRVAKANGRFAGGLSGFAIVPGSQWRRGTPGSARVQATEGVADEDGVEERSGMMDKGTLMISPQLKKNADSAADLLSALGNGKRFLIMCHLVHGELSVGTIAEKVGLSQSALSQHLAKLRALDLVATRREKQTIYYSCKSDDVRRILAMMDDIYGAYSKAAE